MGSYVHFVGKYIDGMDRQYNQRDKYKTANDLQLDRLRFVRMFLDKDLCICY